MDARIEAWDDRLRGVGLKLGRASQHLEALSDDVTSYIENTDAFEFRGRFDPATSVFVIEAEMKREPPESLGLIVGDLVQNARAALDHLVWALVSYRGLESPGTHTQFPITDSPSRFADKALTRKTKRGRLVLGNLHGLIPDDVELVRAVQPYEPAAAVMPDKGLSPYLWAQAGLHPLTALAAISNHDKHRVVHATAVDFFHWTDVRGEVGSPDWMLGWNADAGTIERVDYRNARLTLGQTATLATITLANVGADPQVALLRPSVTPLYTEWNLGFMYFLSMLSTVIHIIERFAPIFI